MGLRLSKWGVGIRLKKRLTRFFRRYRKVNRLMRSVRRWGKKVRGLFGPGSGYVRLGRVRVTEEVPKGYVAVYVAEERVVVPVICVNHPLFGRLLREAEETYGFDHPGGITLPCHVSELEHVQTMIATTRRNQLLYHNSTSMYSQQSHPYM